MIRFRDKILEDYFIDPKTAVITNSKGEVQKIKIKDGRPYFKRHWLHQWQVHTHIGYKEGFDIHHIDENKMNNSLSNLVYLTHSEHSKIHNKIGKKLSDETKRKLSEAKKNISDETKKKMSEAHKGKTSPNKGKHYKWITNGIENRQIAKNIPIPDGFRKGRTINRNRNVGVI